MDKVDINITRPFLPPAEDYERMINGIWQRNWLTNNGPLVQELESRLSEYLGVQNLLFVGNGTIALQIAIKALDLKGEIITTPFSYIATTSSILWENCRPVFVDIREDTYNINHELIEEAITPETKAILATHVYGNPCDVDFIQSLASKYGLKVIYDAAHCFGTLINGDTILNHGDIATISFHATKVFHTVEGGGLISKDPELIKEMAYMRNFGHDGPDRFHGVGINGKNSEFHAAMGLVNLNYIDQILQKYKNNYTQYFDTLKGFKFPTFNKNVEWNYAYVPILLENSKKLISTIQRLNKNRIYPRRYFYPALNRLDFVDNKQLPVCNEVEQRILCLPQYYDMSESDIDSVCNVILRAD